MVNEILVQGFLFGIRVANNINGNAVDIELNTILDALSGLASGRTTLQPTGAELKMKFPEFNIAEHVLRLNASHDQTLAKALLDHIRGSLPDNKGTQS